MQELTDINKEKMRSPKDGEWYWASKPIIQEWSAKVGLLAIGVYHLLASMADETQHCFPSQKYIALRLGCSRTSVNKAIKTLRESKLIRVQKQVRGHHEYYLLKVGSSKTKQPMCNHDTPAVQGENTNKNNVTRNNNKNVFVRDQDMNNEAVSNADTLAKEILLAHDLADGLEDKERYPLYLSYAKQYSEPFLRELLSHVKQTPIQKIKKSRGAFFNYLIKKYGNKPG